VLAKVREGSPRGRSETTGAKICETSRFQAGSQKKRQREVVMDEQSGDSEEEEVMGEEIGELEIEELNISKHNFLEWPK